MIKYNGWYINTFKEYNLVCGIVTNKNSNGEMSTSYAFSTPYCYKDEKSAIDECKRYIDNELNKI